MSSFEFIRPRILSLGIAALMVVALLPSTARSADSQVASPDVEVPFVLSGDVASVPSSPSYHILRAHTEVGRHAALIGPVGQSKTQAAAIVKSLAALAKPGFFPGDVTYLNGLLVESGNQANIYYNCANESCFGDPEGFLTDLAVSKFIHVVDQYIGSKKNNRYPLSLASTVLLSGGTSLDSNDIVNLVHSAAVQVGTGHIFHLFLPQGVDVCAETNVCYSPDNTSTFAFCAYHSFTTFSDLGGALVTYTVQPYQDVNGCALEPPNPNSQMIDSTNTALLHETFETITDPFPPTGWIAENSLVEQGNEIADICVGPGNGSGEGIAPSYLLVKGHTFQTQLIYSNFRHGCVATP